MPKERAPVQGDETYELYADHPSRKKNAKPSGTISWEEHVEAWNGYERKYGRGYQSAERIAERGGFGYEELMEFLGKEPTTWKERK